MSAHVTTTTTTMMCVTRVHNIIFIYGEEYIRSIIIQRTRAYVYNVYNYNIITRETRQIQFLTRPFFIAFDISGCGYFYKFRAVQCLYGRAQNKQTSRANRFGMMAAVQSNNKDRRLYIVKATHLIIFHK